MKITLNNYVLASGSSQNESPTNLTVTGDKNIQIVKTLRAESVKALDRGNLCVQIVFEVGRRHKSKEEAEAYALIHASNIINAYGNLLIELEDKQKRSYVLDNAVINHINTRYHGNASHTTYTIFGGLLHENN